MGWLKIVLMLSDKNCVPMTCVWGARVTFREHLIFRVCRTYQYLIFITIYWCSEIMTTQHYVLTSKWMCKDGYVTSVETVPYIQTQNMLLWNHLWSQEQMTKIQSLERATIPVGLLWKTAVKHPFSQPIVPAKEGKTTLSKK